MDDKPVRSWAKRMQRRTATSYRLTLELSGARIFARPLGRLVRQHACRETCDKADCYAPNYEASRHVYDTEIADSNARSDAEQSEGNGSLPHSKWSRIKGKPTLASMQFFLASFTSLQLGLKK